MQNKKYRVLIIGLGNLIMSDDGIGIHLIRKMGERKPSLQEISLLELGTSPLYYLEEISKTETLIVLDAIKGGESPGSVYCFEEKDLDLYPGSFRDFHGYSILEVIALSRELTDLPAAVFFYGVEPENIAPGMELSPSVKAVITELIELIISNHFPQLYIFLKNT